MESTIEGQSWPWHQDYVYWKEGDYIETPRLLNVAMRLMILLCSVSLMCYSLRSHQFGDLTKHDEITAGSWAKDVSSDLTYKIDKNILSPLIAKNGHEFLICNAVMVCFLIRSLHMVRLIIFLHLSVDFYCLLIMPYRMRQLKNQNG